MNIEEAINRLQVIREEEGNVPVYFGDGHHHSGHDPVEVIEYDPDAATAVIA